MKRLRLLLTRAEFTVFVTLVFAALYFWPFIAFARPVRVVRFIFVVWLAQIAICFVRSVWGIEESENTDNEPQGGDSVD